MNITNTIDLILREPTILDGDKIFEMRDEFLSTHCKFNGTCNLDMFDNYIDWLAHTINQTHGSDFNNNPSSVKHTFLVLNLEDELIGMVEIIFYYNYKTLQRCAHVIECIRPTFRRHGLGKPLRKKAIQECTSLGTLKKNITSECNCKACNDTMNKIINF